MRGSSHLSPTLPPPLLYAAWAKGGTCVALPTFLPLFHHLSYAQPGQGVGYAWLFPPFSHPSTTLPCMLRMNNQIKKEKPLLLPFWIDLL
ncbi:hypothetical protein AC622_14720 [Bacillus sp. FJAT-27916]|nr:hypothetical protein AC622_14720 [Bacillus sp. FJAT-27916]